MSVWIKRIKRVGDVALVNLERVPVLRPLAPQLALTASRVGREAAALVHDEAGQSGLTSNLARTAIVLALTLLVVGVIIWGAVVSLANDTAADIESAAGWG